MIDARGGRPGRGGESSEGGWGGCWSPRRHLINFDSFAFGTPPESSLRRAVSPEPLHADLQSLGAAIILVVSWIQVVLGAPSHSGVGEVTRTITSPPLTPPARTSEEEDMHITAATDGRFYRPMPPQGRRSTQGCQRRYVKRLASAAVSDKVVLWQANLKVPLRVCCSLKCCQNSTRSGDCQET